MFDELITQARAELITQARADQITQARADAMKIVLNGGEYTKTLRRLAWGILTEHGVKP